LVFSRTGDASLLSCRCSTQQRRLKPRHLRTSVAERWVEPN
jgi:hypothetical protein